MVLGPISRAAAVLAATATALIGAPVASGAPAALSVTGNRLLAGGLPIQLRGADYTYAVSACSYASSDPEPNIAATISEMQAWGVNAVRLLVSSDCWLGVNNLPNPTPGESVVPDAAGYRAYVQQRVGQFEAAGMWVTLGPDDNADWMPNQQVLDFWRSAAATFRADTAVMPDLINEVPLYAGATVGDPTAGAPGPSVDSWTCWRDGCTTNKMGGAGRVSAIGMQALLDAVRLAGDQQPVLIGSLSYNSEQGPGGADWVGHLPADSAAPNNPQIVLDSHRYDFVDGDGSGAPNGQSGFDIYFDGELTPIAGSHPAMFGEIGEIHCDDAKAGYSAHALARIDSLQAARGLTVSALGWEWRGPGAGYACPTGNPPGSNGPGGPLLLHDANGAPSAEGQAFKSWFAAHLTSAGSGGTGTSGGAGGGASGGTSGGGSSGSSGGSSGSSTGAQPAAPGASGSASPPSTNAPPFAARIVRVIALRNGSLRITLTLTAPARISATGRSHAAILRSVIRQRRLRVVHRLRLRFGGATAELPSGLVSLNLIPTHEAAVWLREHRRVAVDVTLTASPAAGGRGLALLARGVARLARAA